MTSAVRRGAFSMAVVLGLGAWSPAAVTASAVTVEQVGNVLSVRDTQANVGQAAVEVPVDLASETNLTVLAFTLTFDTSLCATLVNPTAMTVRRAGRSSFLLEPTPGCAGGSMRVAFNSGQGDVVIPPRTTGDLQILAIVLGDLRADAQPGPYNFGIADVNFIANNGPLTVPVTRMGGALTIVNACGNGRVDAGEGCDDGNTQAGDCCSPTCQPESGQMCSDGNPCTVGDVCVGATCQPGPPRTCPNDNNPCTDDLCNTTTGQCGVNNAAQCSDGNPCTVGDACAGGSCRPGPPRPCPNDGNPCTNDICNSTTGQCGVNNTAECSDGNPCTVGDVCANGNCRPGPPRPCPNDNNPCTDDICNPATGQCGVNNTDPCEDPLFCTDGDRCSGGACGPGGARNCSDGKECTDDACNEGARRCDNDPTAHVGQPCAGGMGRCLADGTCFVQCTRDQDCEDDGLDCTVERCVNNVCVRPPDDTRCSDRVACTRDRCNPGSGCSNTADDTLCDDGLFCTGPETCDAERGCQRGQAPDCGDTNECTTDRCAEDLNACVHDPTPNVGRPCNSGRGVCGADGMCVGCLTDGDCADGLFCTGVETCNTATQTCRPGPPPPLDDGLACTADSCNEAADRVDHVPQNGACADGLFCNGAERCDAQNGCQPGTPPRVDDGNACTDDSCNEATDMVVHDPSAHVGQACNGAMGRCDETGACVPCLEDSDCDNGEFCDGTEVCDFGTNRCGTGVPVMVDDGVACTADGCDEATDRVTHVPDDTACADASPCTNDVCDAGTGCEHVSLPDATPCEVRGIPGLCMDGECILECVPVLSGVEGMPAAVLAAVEQACPTCPESVRTLYRAHGDYVSCVSHAAEDMDAEHRGRLVREAAHSDVGR